MATIPAADFTFVIEDPSGSGCPSCLLSQRQILSSLEELWRLALLVSKNSLQMHEVTMFMTILTLRKKQCGGPIRTTAVPNASDQHTTVSALMALVPWP